MTEDVLLALELGSEVAEDATVDEAEVAREPVAELATEALVDEAELALELDGEAVIDATEEPDDPVVEGTTVELEPAADVVVGATIMRSVRPHL